MSLKKKIKSRNSFVKSINTLYENVNKPENDEDTLLLQSTIETIEEKLTKIVTLQEAAEDLINDENESEKFTEEATNIELDIRTKLNTLRKKMKSTQHEVSSSTSTTTRSKLREDITYSKLPKLEISKFDGDFLQWQTFYDSFKAAIHDKKNLSDVDKFNYLRSLLRGSALRVIEGFTLTNENYTKALSLLEERYNNKQAIISSHMNELLKMKKIQNNNVTEIRKLHDGVESHIRSLSSMGIKDENFGSLLAPVIMERLPDKFRHDVSRGLKDEPLWNLTKLLEIIKEELKVLENCSSTCIPTGKNDLFNSFESQISSGASLYTGQLKTVSCVFCKKPHYSDKCNVITDSQARKEFLKKGGRCFLCLKPNHKINECTKSKPCYYCKGLHNSAICPKHEKGDSHEKRDSKKHFKRK